ncbi:MAG TPA: T9SS type A sorting domain-containing protein [Flavipsychrobacter sp.]|nr:T9SS type A sorting domain-containing protein [Flavipsychrobacter sp.]
MKKNLLLLLIAITFSFSGFAQTTMVLQPGIGDTAYFFNNFNYQLVDTLTNPVITGPGGLGFYTGMNKDNLNGYAECYDPGVGTLITGDTAWQIVGVLSLWYGDITSGATTVTINVWPIDTLTIEGLGTGDSVTGYPASTPITSQDVSVTSLNIDNSGGHNDLVTPIMFTTPANHVFYPFFVGYTMTYDWNALLGDTVALRSTHQGAGANVTTYFYNKSNSSGTYRMFHSRNAYNDPNSITSAPNTITGSTWHDFAVSGLKPLNLSIVPIIVQYNATSVNAITRNNLTFFGNYPNPAINNTNIKYSLKNGADVSVLVMDMTGRVINTIKQPSQTAGEHIVTVQTANMPAGDYLYEVTTNDGSMAGKFTVAK